MRAADRENILETDAVLTGAAIPQHVIERVLAAIEPSRASACLASAAVLEKEAEIVRPRVSPPGGVVTSMLLGLDGTVWVTLPQSTDGAPMLVLDSEGELVASLTVPHGWTVVQASLSHVWMAKAGSRGLAGSVRYRVSRGEQRKAG